MLTTLLILLLLSNALTLKREKSILFSRIVIKSLLLVSFLSYNNLYLKPLEKGIGIYGGIFNVTTFTQTFNIFILLVSAVVLTLTAFYFSKQFILNIKLRLFYILLNISLIVLVNVSFRYGMLPMLHLLGWEILSPFIVGISGVLIFITRQLYFNSNFQIADKTSINKIVLSFFIPFIAYIGCLIYQKYTGINLYMIKDLLVDFFHMGYFITGEWFNIVSIKSSVLLATNASEGSGLGSGENPQALNHSGTRSKSNSISSSTSSWSYDSETVNSNDSQLVKDEKLANCLYSLEGLVKHSLSDRDEFNASDRNPMNWESSQDPLVRFISDEVESRLRQAFIDRDNKTVICTHSDPQKYKLRDLGIDKNHGLYGSLKLIIPDKTIYSSYYGSNILIAIRKGEKYSP